MWATVAVFASLLMATQDVQLPAPPRGFSPTQADMVVDGARVLSADAVARINRIIFDVKAQSGGEIVIVTLPDLGGRDVADVALRIGRDWKVGAAADVGDRTRNAGVVVLVVPKETSSDGRGYIAIQTGQGAEGFITDATTGDIRREAIPFFQRQDYSTALELITLRVAQRYEREFGFALDTSVVPQQMARPPSTSARGIPPKFVFFAFVIAMVMLSGMANASRRGGNSGCLTALLVADAMSHSRRRGGWGGGGFGGGSWGGGGGGGGFGGFGGGGGFSGGGSSGSW